jgi:hypothetical protein
MDSVKRDKLQIFKNIFFPNEAKGKVNKGQKRTGELIVSGINKSGIL